MSIRLTSSEMFMHFMASLAMPPVLGRGARSTTQSTPGESARSAKTLPIIEFAVDKPMSKLLTSKTTNDLSFEGTTKRPRSGRLTVVAATAAFRVGAVCAVRLE